MITAFTPANFKLLCDTVARQDVLLQNIIVQYDYPPVWSREPTFETLVHIVLEQQVSLASARAALNKLKEKLGIITPKKIMAMADEDLRACYFSRQKTGYAKHLAAAVLDGHLTIETLNKKTDEAVRQQLKKIKGIGDWTADVFLMMALHRCDLFPVGDIALVNSVRYELAEPKMSKEEILLRSLQWKPYRTIAAFLFWHAYIQRKGILVQP